MQNVINVSFPVWENENLGSHSIQHDCMDIEIAYYDFWTCVHFRAWNELETKISFVLCVRLCVVFLSWFFREFAVIKFLIKWIVVQIKLMTKGHPRQKKMLTTLLKWRKWWDKKLIFFPSPQSFYNYNHNHENPQ